MRLKNLESYVINEGCSLRDAMLLIDENKHRCLIVVDDNMKVIGSISDGDIRKAILRECLLTTKVTEVMNVRCYTVNEDEKDGCAKVIFDKEHIFLVPVVNSSGVIVAIDVAY